MTLQFQSSLTANEADVTLFKVGNRVVADIRWTTPPSEADQQAAEVFAVAQIQERFPADHHRYESLGYLSNDVERGERIRRFLGGGIG